MKAIVFEHAGKPLVLKQLPVPQPGAGQLLVKVIACGICRTDLHIIDGELPNHKMPLILGHEIIGEVAKIGNGVKGFHIHDWVGIPWLGYTCGVCKYCRQGKENLCDNAKFTGYTIDGGYAEYTVAFSRFCFLLNERFATPSSAPLLCAGLIGYRAYKMISTTAKNIGVYGFGAAAHIITQVARSQGKTIYAFTQPGDDVAQAFACNMGAGWAGSSNEKAPQPLDAAIIFAAVGELVVKALANVNKAGEVICGGIHMSDIPSFSYKLLWEERLLRSVANLTRQDGLDFFELLKQVNINTQTTIFKLEQANEAVHLLRTGQINGAAVLVM